MFNRSHSKLAESSYMGEGTWIKKKLKTPSRNVKDELDRERRGVSTGRGGGHDGESKKKRHLKSLRGLGSL